MIYVLSQKVYEGADNLPCIMIELKDVEIDLEGYDALLFSSKNGVNAIERLNSDWKNIPAYSIGSGTSDTIEALGGNLVYSARSSYGDDFAQEIKTMLGNKKVLFLRAKVVTSALNTILAEAGVILSEAIVYETKCAACETLKKPELGAIIIFSSPSTIACFFKCFRWDDSYQAIVIGDKTASYMPKNISYLQSDKQSIPSCIELANRLSKKGL